MPVVDVITSRSDVLTNVNIVQAVGDGVDGTSKIVHYKNGRVAAGFLTCEILTFYGELLNGCATTRERREGEARLFLGLGTYEDLARLVTKRQVKKCGGMANLTQIVFPVNVGNVHWLLMLLHRRLKVVARS